MAFLGLIPAEHTSGEKGRQGEITKAGNGHTRRFLVEAAWNYPFPARISSTLLTGQEDQPKPTREIAWRAQLRLTRRFARPRFRQLSPNKVCVAIAASSPLSSGTSRTT